MATALLGGTGVALLAATATTAFASPGTSVLTQTFNDNTVDGAGAVQLATGTTTTAACLTAAGNSGTNPLASCPTTTIAAPSNGVKLPVATINVASTTGFPTSGTISVTTASGAQTVAYTGVTSTAFTGATGGTAVISTRGAVASGLTQDWAGTGVLRLTPMAPSLKGGVFASTIVPVSQGFDATFNSYQYGGTGGDGIGFVLAAVNPAAPVVPAVGPTSGSLGYSAHGSAGGLADGYLGVGLDAFGNFSNSTYEGSGCTNPAFIAGGSGVAGTVPGQVVVRGPGNGAVGYCALQSSAANAITKTKALPLHNTTRANSKMPVEVALNTSASSMTTLSGLVVPAGDYNVTFTPHGESTRSLVGALPVVPLGLYPAGYTNAAGYPKQLAFGWVSSTAAATDYHEIDSATMSTLSPAPQLSVSQTAYAAAVTAGSPVTYQVTANTATGTETSPVAITETLPTGIVPLAAAGTNWVCGVPSGQSVSCTNSTNPFTSGALSVNGLVASGTIAQSLTLTARATASSSDAAPGTASSASAGTVPVGPTVSAVSPTRGGAGGGNDVTVSGSNLGGTTVVEIGSIGPTGTFAKGTARALVPCSGGAITGCFTITSATSIDIPSMPTNSATAVVVRVVSLGVASPGASYTYSGGPVITPNTPSGGDVGVAYRDLLAVTGGTAPYTWTSSGSLPSGLTLGASTGLLSGTPSGAGTFPFTVTVKDSASPKLVASLAASATITAAPTLSFATPPNGETNAAYSYTLTASGGSGPYIWSSTGTLPAGITLANGVLSGTPKAAGISSFTVQVSDSLVQSASRATTLTVNTGVSTSGVPIGAAINVGYYALLSASGGTAPYTWAVNTGTLPPGIYLTSAGKLSGFPTTLGTTVFGVSVADAQHSTVLKSITLVVATAVTLSFVAPPVAQLNTAYSFALTGAAGGTLPYGHWSISSGAAPTGITLSSAGVLSGTPTAGGTASFTVKVADKNGLTATHATTLTVPFGLTLGASASTVPWGSLITLTANLAPVGATGTVTFSDVLSGGPRSGQTVTLGTGPMSAGSATLRISLPAFNINTVTASYGGDATYGAASSSSVVQVMGYAGELVVKEFRLSGPAGPNDQYVELYNTGAPVPLAGVTVLDSSGIASITLPSSAPTLPTGHSYLLTGSAYSLAAVAASDTSGPSLATSVVVKVPDSSLPTVVDAVGFVGAPSGYFRGTALPAFSGTPTNQYAYVRLESKGAPVNSGNNAADFKLVSTTGGLVGGVQSTLGSPAPQGTTSLVQDNANLFSKVLDQSEPSNVAPNFVYAVGSPGLLTVRRIITNTSGATISKAEIRITSLSEANGAPEPGVSTQPSKIASIRLANPTGPTSDVVTSGGTVTVANLTMDGSADPSLGGGLNTTLTVPLPQGLLSGAWIRVAFTFQVDRAGTYWFGYDVDAP